MNFTMLLNFGFRTKPGKLIKCPISNFLNGRGTKNTRGSQTHKSVTIYFVSGTYFMSKVWLQSTFDSNLINALQYHNNMTNIPTTCWDKLVDNCSEWVGGRCHSQIMRMSKRWILVSEKMVVHEGWHLIFLNGVT